MIGQRPVPRPDRRVLLIGAGLGGVLLGLLLLMTVFAGGGDEGVTGVATRRAAPTTPSSTTIAPARSGVEISAALARGRDPFHQATGGEQPGPVVGADAAVALDPATATATARADGRAATATAADPEGGDYASLELVSISKDAAGVERAQVKVDGQPFNPAEGDVFSYGFRLERIDGGCVEVSSQGERVHMCVPG